MSAQDVILGARVAHVRELKAELSKEKAANAALRDENAALRAHVDLACLAAEDLRRLPADGVLELWDGWNLVLGAQKEARDRAALVAQARERLAAPGAEALRIWIVFDGPREKVENDGRLRVSYTGGTGEQRADRAILAFVRFAAYLGLAGRVRVRTNDRELSRRSARVVMGCAGEQRLP